MCPGLARSSGFASSRIAVSIVCALSWADTPVVTPCLASTDTVKAVLSGDVFSATIGFKSSSSAFSSVNVRQISPLPNLVIKFMASGVTFSAARVRSPSFSLSSSSTRMTILPSLISFIAASTIFIGTLIPPLATCISCSRPCLKLFYTTIQYLSNSNQLTFYKTVPSQKILINTLFFIGAQKPFHILCNYIGFYVYPISFLF